MEMITRACVTIEQNDKKERSPLSMAQDQSARESTAASSGQPGLPFRRKTIWIAALASLMILTVAAVLVATFMKPKVIGFTAYDLSLDFFHSMEMGVMEGAESLGYQSIRHDQAGDETRLVTSFKRLIEEQVAAIIVSPISPEVLPPLVDSAHEKGIPVIINDIGGGGSDYDAIVISDNWQGGVLAADYSADYLKGQEGSRKVAIITVEPSAVYAARR
ncbi:MAG: sugar ABC transporter substrate-binding protein, partial [Clostridia bacterium]|nr:sugar ABC transporter substrate-binding protein [Clostridia bacterium]